MKLTIKCWLIPSNTHRFLANDEHETWTRAMQGCTGKGRKRQNSFCRLRVHIILDNLAEKLAWKEVEATTYSFVNLIVGYWLWHLRVTCFWNIKKRLNSNTQFFLKVWRDIQFLTNATKQKSKWKSDYIAPCERKWKWWSFACFQWRFSSLQIYCKRVQN